MNDVEANKINDEMYYRLMGFLDTLPCGFPETESHVEIKILKKMFEPEEVGIILSMTSGPETVSSIAQKLGMDEVEASRKVESMAWKGLLLRIKMGGINLYMASQFAPGVWEWQMNRMDREFSELVHEYFPSLARPWSSLSTQPLRVVPLNPMTESGNS